MCLPGISSLPSPLGLISSGVSFVKENVKTCAQEVQRVAKTVAHVYADFVSTTCAHVCQSCITEGKKLSSSSDLPEAVREVLKKMMFLVAEGSCFFMSAALQATLLESFEEESQHIDPTLPSVLLVHGFLGTSGSFAYPRKCLLDAGVKNVFSISLGSPFQSIQEYATAVSKKIRSIQSFTQNPQVVLIGHSMGGLVCREYKQQHSHEDGVVVPKIITIGAPLGGTVRGELVSWISQAASQMRPNSPLIVEQQRMAAEDEETEYIQIASSSDETVSVESATAGNGMRTQNTVLDSYGHVSMLLSRQVIEILLHQLSPGEKESSSCST